MKRVLVVLALLALVLGVSGLVGLKGKGTEARWLMVEDSGRYYGIHLDGKGGFDAGIKYVPGTGWENLPQGAVRWER